MSLDLSLQLSSANQCGAHESFRIFNGKILIVFDHPWFALIHIKSSIGEKSICGGSLINSQFVVTGEKFLILFHFLKKKSVKSLQVLLKLSRIFLSFLMFRELNCKQAAVMKYFYGNF